MTEEITGRVIVEPHAIDQALTRVEDWGKNSRAGVALSIELCIREAFRNGSLYERKPKAFRRFGETKNARPIMPGQRYAVHGDKMFVIDLGKSPDVYVVTTLVRMAKVRAA